MKILKVILLLAFIALAIFSVYLFFELKSAKQDIESHLPLEKQKAAMLNDVLNLEQFVDSEIELAVEITLISRDLSEILEGRCSSFRTFTFYIDVPISSEPDVKFNYGVLYKVEDKVNNIEAVINIKEFLDNKVYYNEHPEKLNDILNINKADIYTSLPDSLSEYMYTMASEKQKFLSLVDIEDKGDELRFKIEVNFEPAYYQNGEYNLTFECNYDVELEYDGFWIENKHFYLYDEELYQLSDTLYKTLKPILPFLPKQNKIELMLKKQKYEIYSIQDDFEGKIDRVMIDKDIDIFEHDNLKIKLYEDVKLYLNCCMILSLYEKELKEGKAKEVNVKVRAF